MEHLHQHWKFFIKFQLSRNLEQDHWPTGCSILFDSFLFDPLAFSIFNEGFSVLAVLSECFSLQSFFPVP
jgi:hypothetical protein